MKWLLLYFIVCAIGVLVTPKHTFLWRYSWNALIALDNFINATVFLGDPDETISSHAHKGRLKGNWFWTQLANFLDWIDPNHGENNVEWDEGTESGLSTLFKRKGKSKED